MTMAATVLPLALFLLTTLRTGHAQSTTNDPSTCTYSFVVPQTDLLTTCQSYSSQQGSLLQRKIDALENEVAVLKKATGRTGHVPNDQNITSLNPVFHCSCQNDTSISFTFRDCQDVKTVSGGPSGVYVVEPLKETGQLISIGSAVNSTERTRYWSVKTWGSIRVFCDLSDDDVGWTVIMKKTTADNFTFDRTWEEYRKGFGNIEGRNFWLGLDTIHQLTSQRFTDYELWVVLVNSMGYPHILSYGTFSVDGPDTAYRLHLEDYYGRGSEYLSRSNGKPFVTKDFDPFDTLISTTTPSYYYRSKSNDAKECATSTKSKTAGGGWWFSSYDVQNDCGYTSFTSKNPYHSGITDIKRVEMKIRPQL